jgi:hypothetical protein
MDRGVGAGLSLKKERQLLTLLKTSMTLMIIDKRVPKYMLVESIFYYPKSPKQDTGYGRQAMFVDACKSFVNFQSWPFIPLLHIQRKV